MTANEAGQGAHQSGDYDVLRTLEDLESLLEELDEVGIEGEISVARLPVELRERVIAADVATTDELRTRIAKLHAQLDREDTA